MDCASVLFRGLSQVFGPVNGGGGVFIFPSRLSQIRMMFVMMMRLRVMCDGCIVCDALLYPLQYMKV